MGRRPTSSLLFAKTKMSKHLTIELLNVCCAIRMFTFNWAVPSQITGQVHWLLWSRSRRPLYSRSIIHFTLLSYRIPNFKCKFKKVVFYPKLIKTLLYKLQTSKNVLLKNEHGRRNVTIQASNEKKGQNIRAASKRYYTSFKWKKVRFAFVNAFSEQKKLIFLYQHGEGL